MARIREPRIPRILPFRRGLLRPKSHRWRTLFTATRSSIPIATWRILAIPTPSSMSSGNWPTPVPSLTRCRAETKSTRAFRNFLRSAQLALRKWEGRITFKNFAYGTSASCSELSTLRVIETATSKLLPDAIERTRAASLAWKPDNSGFFYTRYPKKGDVAEGQEVYHRHVFYHALGDDPSRDTLIFGEGRDPENWPNVHLSEDGRWLLIDEEQGWTKTELFDR